MKDITDYLPYLSGKSKGKPRAATGNSLNTHYKLKKIFLINKKSVKTIVKRTWNTLNKISVINLPALQPSPVISLTKNSQRPE